MGHTPIRLSVNPEKWQEESKPYSKTILLFITNACNLSCDYCFNIPNLHREKGMSLEYIQQLVETNPDISKYDLMGGEPLLHRGINQIISYLESKNKRVGLYTNGYFLENLKHNHRYLKVNISFQSLESEDKSLKPICDIAEQVRSLQYIYPIKLVFLLNNQNKFILADAVKYIENNFENIDTLTIGTVRNEGDYWNDNYSYVVPLREYAEITQRFINGYEGRLNIDIFSKGILYTDNLPQNQDNQINRFKSVFDNNRYVSCLYLIAQDKKIVFEPDKPIPFPDCTSCSRTGRQNCLADKIRLRRKK